MNLELNKKSLYIAITGCVGSGKTTVSNILREYGYYVFDTDLFSKNILSEDDFIIEVIENIIKQKIAENNIINFKKIGKIFDENPLLEEKFENWYQIYLGNKIIERKLDLCNEEKVYFFDIPLLDKKCIANKFDFIWIVESEERHCYERIKMRNNYSNKKITYLIENSKISNELLLYDYRTIKNQGSIEMLKEVVQNEIQNLNLK